MHVVIILWHESATCCWCEKSRECVTLTFSDGFLTQSLLCWKCLQIAFKVRSRQQSDTPAETRPARKKERIPVQETQ